MALKIDMFVKNMDMTDRINDYVMKKVSKLDKFVTGIEETRVDLSVQKSARNANDRQVAQITVRGKGMLLRTEERANDIFEAIDTAVDKMQRKMERYKGKHFDRRGTGAPAAAATQELPETEEAENPQTIARRKRFTMAPMNETEALEQMTLLGHDNFFVFYNADTSAINVLYRRRDGTYGLIEPEIG